MSATTVGRHTRKPENTHRGEERRRWRDRWRRRDVAVPAEPEPGHPYPAAPSDAQITELIAGLPPVKPFSGVSMPDGELATRVPGASLGGYVPRPAGRGAWAAPTRELLGDVLDGLRDLGAPLAFVCRRRGPERLSGRPVYLGTAPTATGHVARIGLGFSEAGGPLEYAANRAVLDEAILVLAQARDDLVYTSSGTGPVPAPGSPASPAVPAAEPDTAAPDAETAGLDHAELLASADEVLGAAAEVAGAEGVQAAVSALVQALNLHKSAVRGAFDPVHLFADLVPGQDGAWQEAMARLAAQIAVAQADLIEVTRKHRGDDVAVRVAGQAGGAL